MNHLVEKFGLNRIKGWKSWSIFAALFAVMFVDQFILNIPFANVVFPALVLGAVLLHPVQSILLAVSYGLVFELYGCIGYYGPTTVVPWTIEVIIGFTFPVLLAIPFRKKANVVSLTAIATVGELFYFWTSVIATAIIWKVPIVSYFLSDLPFELYGCLATVICSFAVFTVIQLSLAIKSTTVYEKTLARSAV